MRKTPIIASLNIAVAFITFAFIAPGWAAVEMEIDFSRHLQEWDGFGVNYVEVPQTRDLDNDPQEYGGFSRLTEAERREILDLIFGEDGLKPGLVKLFLDSWHEGTSESDNDNDDPNLIDPTGFNHTRTTEWMRYFARNGLRITRARGGDLQMIATLYGPPGWTAKQKILRGRDLDPAMKYEVAEYIIAWAKYLREAEKFPVNYVSLHNEGGQNRRWEKDGTTKLPTGHDYNMHWPKEQIVDFIKFMRPMLDRQGLHDVGITPGETTLWRNLDDFGIGDAIADDEVALNNLGLMTSHGFAGGDDFVDKLTSKSLARIQAARPELRAWTTSMSWYKMNSHFINVIRENIYTTHVSGVIPWACVQTLTWKGGDPNPGTAFFVNDEGDYEIRPGYYYYKQVSRAGQPGMAVAKVSDEKDGIGLIAFASNRSGHPDAFVVVNFSNQDQSVNVKIIESAHRQFDARRTSANENYQSLGVVEAKHGVIHVNAKAGSVSAYFGK